MKKKDRRRKKIPVGILCDEGEEEGGASGRMEVAALSVLEEN